MSSQSHLFHESKVLPINDHLSLLCKQYLASALRPTHPSHANVTTPLGPRNKKFTLQSKFLPEVQPFLTDGILPPPDYKKTISQLHTSAVQEAIQSSAPNPILGLIPPEIDPSELSLHRHYRTILSQLRSGHCPKLQSYLHSINAAPSPDCPLCPDVPETVQHLFSCPHNPTDLTPPALWSHPTLVAEFLSTHPSFSMLPALPRPLPEPPP